MKPRLEEMESKTHDNFPAVMKIVKEYCKVKKEEKKKIVRGYNYRRRGGMQVVRDSDGKLIPTGKTYAEYYMEEAEKKKKRREEEKWECGEPSPPREPRWSDENLAMHLWRGVCRRKGVKCHEYVLRTDYSNMTREEIKLDLLWTKVYQAEAEDEAAEAAAEEAAALAKTTTA